MSNFKYELQNVLNLREQQENIKQKEYAQALEVLKTEKAIKKQIDKSIYNNRQMLKHSVSDYIDPKIIKLQQNYQLRLEKEQVMAAKKVEKASVKTEEQRLELLEAMKNKKTLETLKEKRREEFIEEEKKEEQQIIDEIVSFAYTNSD